MNTDKFTNVLTPAEVLVAEGFWKNKMELARTKVIPYEWEALNDRIEGATSSHSIMNFIIAGELTEKRKTGNAVSTSDKDFQGMVFQDSDTAKWLEAAANILMWHKDNELEALIDQVIDIICAAQQPDGYLNTYYIINGLDKRFTNLRDNHELYCLGHMLEAAVAYYQATKKRKLLDAMIHYVELVDRLFGPEPEKAKGYPGHEVIEMALIKLYRITKDERHVKLAKYFIDQRGQSPNYFEEEAVTYGNGTLWNDTYFKMGYFQAHKPVREQDTAIGHAVRAMYLYCGMADVAKETKDESLLLACQNIWNNITEKQMYITGSVGSSSTGESFSFDYDLPNQTAYAETCAAIGLVFFAQRMLLMEPDSRYADIMEKTLFNGIISGISLDGTRFFYLNPLESVPESCEKDEKCQRTDATRQKWFGVACCPPNIARLLSSVGSYIYTVKEQAVYQHLFIGSTIQHMINGEAVRIETSTNYPWDGKVKIKIVTKNPVEFQYAVRIPGWCKNYKLSLNKETVKQPVIEKGYACISRTWQDDNIIELDFSMPVVIMKSNSNVRENTGKCAVMRGPLVYCLEEEDNGGNLHCITMDINGTYQSVWEPRTLDGVTAVYSKGRKTISNRNELYMEADAEKTETIALKWIPYYAWANRSVGEMAVWIRT